MLSNTLGNFASRTTHKKEIHTLPFGYLVNDEADRPKGGSLDFALHTLVASYLCENNEKPRVGWTSATHPEVSGEAPAFIGHSKG